jgi:hypothetical protein
VKAEEEGATIMLDTMKEPTKETITKEPAVRVALSLTTLPEIREFCKVLANTGMIPKAYANKPDDILVAMFHGQELGLPPLQSLQCIAVINGVPSIYGDAGLALVRSKGLLEEYDEWIEIDGVRQSKAFDIWKAVQAGNEVVAYCFTKRVHAPKGKTTWFSVAQAKRAGLWEKKSREGVPSPWCFYPERMLMWRARGSNIRDNFGDVLKGLPIYEEAQDYDLDLQQTAPGTYAMPEPAPEATPAPEAKGTDQAAKGAAVRERLKKAQATAEPPKAETPKPEPAPEPKAVETLSEEEWRQKKATLEDKYNDVFKACKAHYNIQNTSELPKEKRVEFLQKAQEMLDGRQA